MLVEKVTLYNVSASRKRGIPKVKENYAHVKFGSTDCVLELCKMTESSKSNEMKLES